MFAPVPHNQSLTKLPLRKPNRPRFRNLRPATGSNGTDIVAKDLPAAAIYIVDRSSEDYATIDSGLTDELVQVKVFGTASEALRIPRYEAPLFFVVNVELPGLCGFELREMLTERWPTAPGYLISDTYDPIHEIKARCSGATLYFCKPLEPDWLATALQK